MIIAKKAPMQLNMVYGLELYSKKLLVAFASCATMGITIMP